MCLQSLDPQPDNGHRWLEPLVLAPEMADHTCLSPTPSSVTSHWWLGPGRSQNTYTIDTGKRYRSGLLFFWRYRVKHSPLKVWSPAGVEEKEGRGGKAEEFVFSEALSLLTRLESTPEYGQLRRRA